MLSINSAFTGIIGRTQYSRQFKFPPIHFPARKFPANSNSRQEKSRQFIFPPGKIPPVFFPPSIFPPIQFPARHFPARQNPANSNSRQFIFPPDLSLNTFRLLFQAFFKKIKAVLVCLTLQSFQKMLVFTFFLDKKLVEIGIFENSQLNLNLKLHTKQKHNSDFRMI